jgi:pyrroline-5-carboxylate reductase
MGEALLSGALRAGLPRGGVLVVDRDQDRAQQVATRHSVAVSSVTDAATSAGTLVVAVKPVT